MKGRLSVKTFANADKSHRLEPIVAGKSVKPRALKDLMDKLSIVYHSSASA